MRLRSTLIPAVTSTLINGLFIFATPVSAQTQDWGGVCVSDGAATIQGLECLLANLFRVFIPALVLIIFVMLIAGSFYYLTSMGNSKGTEKARNTITYAIIGLVVALSAFILLNLVAEFTGVRSILNFQIPDPDTGL